MRVLHCPSDVGGNAWILSRAERKLGIESDVMVFASHWYGYHSDIDLHLKERSLWGKVATLARYFLEALSYYDVFHFNFGSSMFAHFPGPLAVFNQMDLPLLKLRGKGIVVTYQGCDARQQSYCLEHFPIRACSEPNCYGGKCNIRIDRKRARSIARFSRHADAIYALNPDLLWVLPKKAEFLPYTTIDLEKWRPVAMNLGREEKRFVILHSPTQREVKGTKYIIAAVEELQRTHPDVDLLLAEKIPHDQVKEFYLQADLVVDQLLLGWYGGFAVEAMALGKPVICYLRQEDLGFLPPQMKADLPLIQATPEDIGQVLESAYLNRVKLAEIAVRSRAFVEKWHNPMAIARRTGSTYQSILSNQKSRN